MRYALIIEDDPRVARSVAESLLVAGAYSVEIAVTEAEALAAADRRLPGIIISDVDLKEGGRGPDAVAHIRAQYGMIPTIFVTADPEDEQARAMGAAVLTKPVTARRLVATVRMIAGDAEWEGASDRSSDRTAMESASTVPESYPDDATETMSASDRNAPRPRLIATVRRS